MTEQTAAQDAHAAAIEAASSHGEDASVGDVQQAALTPDTAIELPQPGDVVIFHLQPGQALAVDAALAALAHEWVDGDLVLRAADGSSGDVRLSGFAEQAFGEHPIQLTFAGEAVEIAALLDEGVSPEDMIEPAAGGQGGGGGAGAPNSGGSFTQFDDRGIGGGAGSPVTPLAGTELAPGEVPGIAPAARAFMTFGANDNDLAPDLTASAPDVTAADATGSEDQSVAFDLSAVLTDLDGSESLTVTIAGLPGGASLSAGTNNLDGTWSLTADQLIGLALIPPANFSGTIPLSISATSTEIGSGDTVATTASFSVTVAAVADAPSLEADNATGSEDNAIALDLSAALADTDGSESLAVTVSGLPSGATLSAGTDNLDGTWTLTADQLAGLSLNPPADFSGTIALDISATSTEASNADAATTTASFSITVAAVADAPSLEADNAAGSEDNAIALDLSAALADTDGSESLAVTVSGLPSGASLSAGTDNLDGSWSLTADQLAGLSLTPPADFSGTIALDISATSTEASNADAATTTASFSITVAAVADAPTLQAANVGGIEDNSIAIDLSAALTDTDGSESLAVTITGVPNGASLSAGTHNPDGSWSLTAGQLVGLSFTPPANFSGSIQLGVSATSTEASNGDHATTSTSFSVAVAAVADTPTLQAANVGGTEDHSIALDLSAGLTDTDGSESLAVTITGVPSGASLSAGTHNPDGSWSLTAGQLVGLSFTPPANFSGSIPLSISATSTDANGDHATTSTSFSVAVAAVADTPVVSSSNVSGIEDNSIALDLSAALADTDGSESLAVTITGMPNGASLSAGTHNPDGSWSLTAGQLAGLSFTPPADFSGSIQLGVSATSTEASNGDTATTSASFSVAIAAVADTPVVSSSNVSGIEDNSIALDLSAALADTDGSESLTVKITGVPSGATLSAGVKNPDGSWSLTGDQLSGLSLKPPANFSGNINLGLTATATESANGGTASATSNFQVHVSPDADAVVLAASAALQPSEGGDGTIVSTDNNGSQKDALAGGIGGDKLVGDSSDDLIIGDYGATVELNISAALTDTDGSETVTVTLSGVPNGASLSAGTNLGGGSWLLTSAQLSGLTMSVPSGTSDFTLAVTATVTDKFGSETDAVSQTVSLNVPVASDGAGGDDEISGGAGDDTLLGGGGDDSLEGESGRDLLRGEAGDDVLDGGSGADTLDGGFGDDYAHGGEGDDTLLGGDGADTLNGHTGADLIEGGAVADSIDGGTGTDTASYASSNAGVTVSLATGTGSGGDAQGDVLSSIENLIGSAHADRMTGNSSNNDLRGGDGDDVLTGGGGVDNLYGEGGNDRLIWDSQDRLDGGSGFDIVDARGSSGGTIDLRNQTNIEAVQTGNGNDTVRISLSDVLNETSDNQFFAVLGGGSDTLRIDTSGGWTAVTPTATPGPESAGVDLGVDLTHLQVHSFTNGSATVSVFTDAEVVTT